MYSISFRFYSVKNTLCYRKANERLFYLHDNIIAGGDHVLYCKPNGHVNQDVPYEDDSV